MGRFIVDSGGGAGAVKGTADGEAGVSIDGVSAERIAAAIVLVLRDEINTVRGLLPIPLGTRSVEDIVNAIKAKL